MQPKSKLGKALVEKGKSVTEGLDKPSIPWEGPNGEGPNGGITQGMIGRFLICPDRLRVKLYEGLGPVEKFNANIEYGNFWHCGEEAYKTDPKKPNKWLSAILDYYTKLCHKYPMDREAITHWYGLCREQFPIYVDYWESEPQEENRIRLFSEKVFDVSYTLPSGKTVRLRGKWDGGSLLKREAWLDENKTKSQVNHLDITRQLKFDLQTMLYIITLSELPSCDLHREGYYRHGGGEEVNGVTRSGGAPSGEYPIKGVRYNVVKRSAHKSADSMVKKIQEDIENNRGGEWFGRWNVEISQHDIDVFKKECLHPVLERMCIWWDTIRERQDSPVVINGFTLRDMMNYRMPYGVWNPLDHGGEDSVDEYLRSGSRVGLQRIKNLFPELQDI